MALALVGEAALGKVFEELVSAVKGTMDKAEMFGNKMEELEMTLVKLGPVVRQIEEYNRFLNGSDQSETEDLMMLMKDGKKLVGKCSKIGRWNLPKKSRYCEKLVALDKSLLRFISLHLQAHTARDVKRTLVSVEGIIPTLLSHLLHYLGHRDVNRTLGVSSLLSLLHNLELTIPSTARAAWDVESISPTMSDTQLNFTIHSIASRTIGHNKIKINSLILKVEFNGRVYSTEIRSIDGVVGVAHMDKDKWHETVGHVYVHRTLITELFHKTEQHANVLYQFLKTKDEQIKEACTLSYDHLEKFLWDICTTLYRLPKPTRRVPTRISVEIFNERRGIDRFNSSPSIGSEISVAQHHRRCPY